MRGKRKLGRAMMATVSSLAAIVAGVAVALVSPAAVAQAATTGPCDIYAAGGTPCVAAHSTTRALYGAYNGALYQVRRSSDNATRDIGVLSAGGYANAATQDSFCAGTTCLITIIYDQSGRNNHLTQAPPGGFSGPAAGGYDNLAERDRGADHHRRPQGLRRLRGARHRLPQQQHQRHRDRRPAGGHVRRSSTARTTTAAAASTTATPRRNSRDNGNGTMEAIYFGNIKVWGYGTGNGPWVMADLENGLFSGVNAGFNANDPTVNNRFLTAIIKGEPNHWAIRGGNAQSGGLSTFYNGARPNVAGYNPMKKEGAIILGIGGDNSIGVRRHLLRGRDDLRLPVRRHRERGPGQHHRGRLLDVRRRQPAERRDRGRPVRPVRRRAERQHHQRHPGPAVRLLGRHQPTLDLHLQQAAAGVRQQVPRRQRPGHQPTAPR